MLKKLIPFLLACIVFQNANAQLKTEVPDFKKIKLAIEDKNSPLYYPTLMKRYTDKDTTLNLEEYRHLYYGFSLQPGYSAYGKSGALEDLKKSIADKDVDKIIALEKTVLKEFPFNLRNIYAIEQWLEKKGEMQEAAGYHSQLIGVARAILSSGDGASDTTAMYVISVDHEYDMIGLLGYDFGKSQALISKNGHQMDKMKLEKNDDGIEYLYFNVDRLFDYMDKLFNKKD